MPTKVWLIWFILAAIFIVAEMMTPGFFLLWFGIGALVAAVLAYLRFNPIWQWATFLVVSTVLLAFSRRFAEKVSGKQPAGIGANRLIGKEGMVKEEINQLKGTGTVKVEKDEWRAESSSGETIAAGTKIVVIKIEGTHMVVEKTRGAELAIKKTEEGKS